MGITDLVTPRNGIPNLPVESLVRKTQEMARFYFDGMVGGGLGNIMYVVGGYEKGDPKQIVNEIKDFYGKIPFEQLQDKFEYLPLFWFNSLLPKLGSLIENLGTNSDTAPIYDLIKEMVKVVSPYKSNLMYLIGIIRQYPGYENFDVVVKNPITGKEATIMTSELPA